MNTPSHAIINLALLLPLAPEPSPLLASAIFLGSILPDLPMFVLYAWAKGIRRQSEGQIWSETYWNPFWQTLTHGFHSMPLGLLGAAIAWFVGGGGFKLNTVAEGTGGVGGTGGAIASFGLFLCLSAVLHDLGDLPVHNNDAHRHFLPFSGYRFISPFSYWDRRYHARWVSLVERCLVLVATIHLFTPFESWVIRSLLILVNLLYWSSTSYRFFVRSCEQSAQKPLP